ncbi:hypothetical protein [Kitasatospora sp. HPMI-4]|uniref:hypothetical protein n=1 Tax=Kitasatospora sp. HPMI-4 TaxID=3448443 RepID=UPI003F1A1DAB
MAIVAEAVPLDGAGERGLVIRRTVALTTPSFRRNPGGREPASDRAPLIDPGNISQGRGDHPLIPPVGDAQPSRPGKDIALPLCQDAFRTAGGG